MILSEVRSDYANQGMKFCFCSEGWIATERYSEESGKLVAVVTQTQMVLEPQAGG